jgi:hypothetical protein
MNQRHIPHPNSTDTHQRANHKQRFVTYQIDAAAKPWYCQPDDEKPRVIIQRRRFRDVLSIDEFWLTSDSDTPIKKRLFTDSDYAGWKCLIEPLAGRRSMLDAVSKGSWAIQKWNTPCHGTSGKNEARRIVYSTPIQGDHWSPAQALGH